MKLLMMSVFDSAVGVYAPPFCVRTRGEGIRSFTDACAEDNLPFKKHPQHYRLFLMGEFDDGTGLVVCSKPEPLIGADEIG